jgi:hypothetical protein
MPRYRCCLMGEDGEVVGVEMFNAVDESVARARANELIARRLYPAIEVWDHTELIYRVEKQEAHRKPAHARPAGSTTKSR